MFINDLGCELNSSGMGIQLADTRQSVPLYADYIVLLEESEEELQQMLNKTHEWKRKWRMQVNCQKSKVVHFRRNSQPWTEYRFSLGEKSR